MHQNIASTLNISKHTHATLGISNLFKYIKSYTIHPQKSYQNTLTNSLKSKTNMKLHQTLSNHLNTLAISQHNPTDLNIYQHTSQSKHNKTQHNSYKMSRSTQTTLQTSQHCKRLKPSQHLLKPHQTLNPHICKKSTLTSSKMHHLKK